MTVTLTRSQMLQAWRRRAGLEPSAAACSVERFDCVDIDALIETHMRVWYLDLLDRGLTDLVGPPAADVTSLLTLTVAPCGYEAVITLDPSLRRLASIRLDDWLTDASVVCDRDLSKTLARQPNRFARAGLAAPLSWCAPGGSVRAIPARSASRIVAATGYVDPGPELYVLDECALTHIPDIFKLIQL